MLELSIDYAKVLPLVNRTFSTLLAPSQRIGLAHNRAVSNELEAYRALWKALDPTSSPATHEYSRTLPYHINTRRSALSSQSSISDQASSNQSSEGAQLERFEYKKTIVMKVIEE